MQNYLNYPFASITLSPNLTLRIVMLETITFLKLILIVIAKSLIDLAVRWGILSLFKSFDANL